MDAKVIKIIIMCVCIVIAVYMGNIIRGAVDRSRVEALNVQLRAANDSLSEYNLKLGDVIESMGSSKQDYERSAEDLSKDIDEVRRYRDDLRYLTNEDNGYRELYLDGRRVIEQIQSEAARGYRLAEEARAIVEGAIGD